MATKEPALEGRPFSHWEALSAYLAENGILLLFLLPAVLVLLITQGYPLAYSAYFSFHDWTLARSWQYGYGSPEPSVTLCCNSTGFPCPNTPGP